MVEAVHRKLGTTYSFLKGWDEAKAWALIIKLVQFSSSFDKRKLLSYSCVVDMDAWRKLKEEGLAVPSPIDICNTYCPRVIVWHYAQMVMEAMKGRDSEIDRSSLLHFNFDRNEPFVGPFREEWNRELNQMEQNGGKFTCGPW